MRPKIFLRIASILLILFAAGHTIGHFGRKSNLNERGREVMKAMEDYHFDFRGADQTWDGHMEGYGTVLIFVLLAFAGILWFISGSAEQYPGFSNRILGCVLFFVVANGYVAFKYFFAGPGGFSVVVGLLIAASMMMLARQRTSNT